MLLSDLTKGLKGSRYNKTKDAKGKIEDADIRNGDLPYKGYVIKISGGGEDIYIYKGGNYICKAESLADAKSLIDGDETTTDENLNYKGWQITTELYDFVFAKNSDGSDTVKGETVEEVKQKIDQKTSSKDYSGKNPDGSNNYESNKPISPTKHGDSAFIKLPNGAMLEATGERGTYLYTFGSIKQLIKGYGIEGGAINQFPGGTREQILTAIRELSADSDDPLKEHLIKDGAPDYYKAICAVAQGAGNITAGKEYLRKNIEPYMKAHNVPFDPNEFNKAFEEFARAHISRAAFQKAPKDSADADFQKGDKVKTRSGEIRTVISQEGNQVFVREESNQWYHPSNLTKVEDGLGYFAEPEEMKTFSKAQLREEIRSVQQDIDEELHHKSGKSFSGKNYLADMKSYLVRLQKALNTAKDAGEEGERIKGPDGRLYDVKMEPKSSRQPGRLRRYVITVAGGGMVAMVESVEEARKLISGWKDTKDNSSYRVEILMAGESRPATSGLRFPTEQEANAWGSNMVKNWSAASGYRVVPTSDPVNSGDSDEFSSGQVEALRNEWNKIDTVDPSSKTYTKLIELLNSLPKTTLKQLAGANIKFVSKLAANRVNDAGMTKADYEKEKEFLKYSLNEAMKHQQKSTVLEASRRLAKLDEEWNRQSDPATKDEALWEYEDRFGTKRQGTVSKISDRGGTDITYFFKRKDTGELDVVSGSRLKNARVIGAVSNDAATTMICNECGKKFKKNLTATTVEAKCPGCGGYDTEPTGDAKSKDGDQLVDMYKGFDILYDNDSGELYPTMQGSPFTTLPDQYCIKNLFDASLVKSMVGQMKKNIDDFLRSIISAPSMARDSANSGTGVTCRTRDIAFGGEGYVCKCCGKTASLAHRIKHVTKDENGYVAFYKGKRIEVTANTSYEAQQKAAKEFGAKKSYEVTVKLAEKNGEQVTHLPLDSVKDEDKYQCCGETTKEINSEERYCPSCMATWKKNESGWSKNSPAKDGLQSHADEVLARAGLRKGYDYWWEKGLQAKDTTAGRQVCKALNQSGEFRYAQYQVTHNDEVLISFTDSTKDLKSSSASEWKPGDKGRTASGEIVTIKAVKGDRYLEIEENLEKKVYIPAHGEIEKVTDAASVMEIYKRRKLYCFPAPEVSKTAKEYFFENPNGTYSQSYYSLEEAKRDIDKLAGEDSAKDAYNPGMVSKVKEMLEKGLTDQQIYNEMYRLYSIKSESTVKGIIAEAKGETSDATTMFREGDYRVDLENGEYVIYRNGLEVLICETPEKAKQMVKSLIATNYTDTADASGYTVSHIGGYKIIEGIGPDGGWWFAVGRGETKRFKTRQQAEEHAEMSSDTADAAVYSQGDYYVDFDGSEYTVFYKNGAEIDSASSLSRAKQIIDDIMGHGKSRPRDAKDASEEEIAKGEVEKGNYFQVTSAAGLVFYTRNLFTAMERAGKERGVSTIVDLRTGKGTKVNNNDALSGSMVISEKEWKRWKEENGMSNAPKKEAILKYIKTEGLTPEQANAFQFSMMFANFDALNHPIKISAEEWTEWKRKNKMSDVPDKVAINNYIQMMGLSAEEAESFRSNFRNFDAGEFEESKHPRESSGKFTSGGGSSKKSESGGSEKKSEKKSEGGEKKSEEKKPAPSISEIRETWNKELKKEDLHNRNHLYAAHAKEMAAHAKKNNLSAKEVVEKYLERQRVPKERVITDPPKTDEEKKKWREKMEKEHESDWKEALHGKEDYKGAREHQIQYLLRGDRIHRELYKEDNRNYKPPSVAERKKQIEAANATWKPEEKDTADNEYKSGDFKAYMTVGASKEGRMMQREELQKHFPDYRPERHDAFVIKYNQEVEKRRLAEYNKNRGL